MLYGCDSWPSAGGSQVGTRTNGASSSTTSPVANPRTAVTPCPLPGIGAMRRSESSYTTSSASDISPGACAFLAPRPRAILIALRLRAIVVLCATVRSILAQLSAGQFLRARSISKAHEQARLFCQPSSLARRSRSDCQGVRQVLRRRACNPPVQSWGLPGDLPGWYPSS